MNQDERVARILGEWQEDRERGVRVDPDAVIAEHPDLEGALRGRFDALQAMETFFEAEDEAPKHPDSIGDYRIIRELGRGGMGVVYEAEQLSMERPVALKVLSVAITSTPQAVKRFQREAKAAGKLHHTNIVPIYGMGQHSGYWYYAMELVEGRPLSDVIVDLRDHKRPTESDLARASVNGARVRSTANPVTGTRTGDRAYFVRVAEMFAGVADALELAHDEGVIHRDVKPSNLMLTADGTLKVVDFGLARFDDESLSMTLTGDLLGTPIYMSPEQAMAKRMGIDRRTDVYSLGATLYEILTLKPPFDATNLQELCSQIITKDPALPRRSNQKIPRDLETIVMKAMEKDRDRRYQSAREFARDLRAFAEGGPIRARRISRVGRAWRKVKRHKVRSSLAAAVLVLGGVGAILGLQAAEEAARRRNMEYLRLCAEGWQQTFEARLGSRGHELEPDLVLPSQASFAAAIEIEPGRPEAYLARAVGLGARTASQRLEDVEKAKSRGLASRTARLARAYVFAETGQHERAEDERRLAGEARARSPLEYLLECGLAKLRGDHGLAEDLAGKAVESVGDRDARVLLVRRLRGGLRLLRGDHEGALEDFLVVREAGDNSVASRIVIATLWRKLGRKGKAAAEFEDVCASVRKPGTEQAWLVLGRTLNRLRVSDWLDQVSKEAIKRFPDAANTLVLRAVALTRLGEFGMAIEKCDEATQRESESAAALFMRGICLAKLGRHSEAILAYKSALRHQRVFPTCRSALSYSLLRAGRREQALAAADRAVEQNPASSTAHRARAVVQYFDWNLTEALRAVDRAIELDAGNWGAHCARGTILRDLGRSTDALAAFEKALELNPAHSCAQHARGLLLVSLGRGEEGRRLLERALAAEAAEPCDPATVAGTLSTLGRVSEADAAFRRARDQGDTNWVTLVGEASHLMDSDRTKEACPLLLRAIELGTRDVRVFGQLAAALMEQGQVDEALRWVEKGVSLPGGIDVHRAWLHAVRCDALLRASRPREALNAIDKSLALDSSSARSLALRATALNGLRRFKDALECCQLAIASDNQTISASVRASIDLHRGEALYFLGKYQEAVLAFEESVRRSESGRARCIMGTALSRLGRLKEAREELERAIALASAGDPARGQYVFQAHANQSYVLLQLAQYDAALAAADSALALRPDSGQAHNQRAAVLIELDRHADAIRSADQALEQGFRAAYNTKGNALKGLGRFDEALEAYGQAIRSNPVTAYFNIAQVHRLRHAPAKAVRALDAGLKIAPDDYEIHYIRACALGELGKFDEAVRSHDKAIKVRPDFTEAHTDKGATLVRLRRYKEALSSFDRALEIAPGFTPALLNRAGVLPWCGRDREALRVFERVLAGDVRDQSTMNRLATAANNAAWYRAASEDPKDRDPESAVAFARIATRAQPQSGNCWGTLGVALYRAGKLEESLKAHRRSVELKRGSDAENWFFMAMAKHRLGQKDAREWFDTALSWMDANKPNAELKRFRAEAEAVLGIKKAEAD